MNRGAPPEDGLAGRPPRADGLAGRPPRADGLAGRPLADGLTGW